MHAFVVASIHNTAKQCKTAEYQKASVIKYGFWK